MTCGEQLRFFRLCAPMRIFRKCLTLLSLDIHVAVSKLIACRAIFPVKRWPDNLPANIVLDNTFESLGNQLYILLSIISVYLLQLILCR